MIERPMLTVSTEENLNIIPTNIQSRKQQKHIKTTTKISLQQGLKTSSPNHMKATRMVGRFLRHKVLLGNQVDVSRLVC